MKKPAPEDEKPLAIRTEKASIKRQNDKGEVVMTAEAESAVSEPSPKNGAQIIRMYLVQGRLLDKGAVASRFRAPRGLVKEDNRVLTLSGGVTVTSEKHGLQLTADQVIWREATQLFEARGNVWVKGASFRSGPADVLVTTAKLDRFGSPDNFSGGKK